MGNFPFLWAKGRKQPDLICNFSLSLHGTVIALQKLGGFDPNLQS